MDSDIHIIAAALWLVVVMWCWVFGWIGFEAAAIAMIMTTAWMVLVVYITVSPYIVTSE